jgi:hypothetical protein
MRRLHVYGNESRFELAKSSCVYALVRQDGAMNGVPDWLVIVLVVLAIIALGVWIVRSFQR